MELHDHAKDSEIVAVIVAAILRAVPIAATIISHMPMAAGGVLAKGHMAAERCCAAVLDG